MVAPQKKYSLDQATVILFNPQPPMRAMLRSAVMGLGFQTVLDYGELKQARNAIIERAPDLVLLDLDGEKDAICGLVREMRNSNLCADPFVPVMVFSWLPNMALVNNVMEAGVDDLIVMPISIKTIWDRVDAMIRHRPEFVVTSSYVGPERRSGGREKIDALGLGTIKVPNTLRFKAMGDKESMATTDAVNDVRARISHHRLNRYAQRIVWVIDEIHKSHVTKTEVGTVTVQRHDEIGRLIEDISYDLRAQGHMELLEIADSMMRLLDTVRARHSPELYEFLRLHSMAINATLLERDGAAALVAQALSETAGYLDRIEAA